MLHKAEKKLSTVELLLELLDKFSMIYALQPIIK